MDRIFPVMFGRHGEDLRFYVTLVFRWPFGASGDIRDAVGFAVTLGAILRAYKLTIGLLGAFLTIVAAAPRGQPSLSLRRSA